VVGGSQDRVGGFSGQFRALTAYRSASFALFVGASLLPAGAAQGVPGIVSAWLGSATDLI
jgi:hypothetical protein